jgi:hypothetical protein
VTPGGTEAPVIVIPTATAPTTDPARVRTLLTNVQVLHDALAIDYP